MCNGPNHCNSFSTFQTTSPQSLTHANKSLSHFSKSASPWCFWFWSTVTECWSRWIIPSIQTAAIVFFFFSFFFYKRANICWRVERGPFQRNDESPVLDCSERGPHVWMRTWEEGWRGERKHFQTTIHILLPFSDTLYSHSVFCGRLFLSVCLLLLFERF